MQTLTPDHIPGLPILRQPGWIIYMLYVILGICDCLLLVALVIQFRHWWAECQVSTQNWRLTP